MSKPVFIQTTRDGSMPAGTILEVASEAAAKRHYPDAKILGEVGTDAAAAAVYRARIASGEIPNPEPESPAIPVRKSAPKKPASKPKQSKPPAARPVVEPSADGDSQGEGPV